MCFCITYARIRPSNSTHSAPAPFLPFRSSTHIRPFPKKGPYAGLFHTKTPTTLFYPTGSTGPLRSSGQGLSSCRKPREKRKTIRDFARRFSSLRSARDSQYRPLTGVFRAGAQWSQRGPEKTKCGQRKRTPKGGFLKAKDAWKSVPHRKKTNARAAFTLPSEKE